MKHTAKTAIAAGLCIWGANALPQDFNQGPVFTVIEENDLVVNTDRHYTQGIRVSYLTGDNKAPGFVKSLSEALPHPGYEPAAVRTGIVIGQNIYTPADTQVRELIPNDRPYSGWLYIGLPLQRRGLANDRWVTLESLQLDLGIVGEDSLAEDAQIWVHEVRGFELPEGWDNQIETEPGLALKYQRSIRFAPKNLERNLDFTPHAGICLGNVETSLRTGLAIRAGFNVPDDFGVQTVSSLLTTEGGASAGNSRISAYIFATVEGWFVAYSTFLDGNMYHNSHSVDREWGVLECKGGVALGMRYGEFAMSYVYRTREFSGQQENNSYGSLSFKVKF